jgi:exonuclease V gamma subunit
MLPAAAMAMDVVVLSSNREALGNLTERITAAAKSNPLARHTVLVDSHAIGRNVVAGIAEQAGMAVGIEPQTLGQYLGQLVHCVETIAGPPTPPRAIRPLPHQAVGLAILQLLPTLQKSGCPALKQHADSVANSHDTSSRLALVSELARSFHAATEATTDHARWEPWVVELHKALTIHATASPPTTADDRLVKYLDRWPRVFAALQKVGSDPSLRPELLNRGAMPSLVFAFDPTLYPASPQAHAIQLLATLTSVSVFLVDPTIRESSEAPSKAWSRRSRRPIEGVMASLEFEKHKPPAPGPAPHGGNALTAIQKSVAGEHLPAGPFPKEDRSVSIHNVPGDLRAAEIVRDTLHRAFVDMPDDLLPEHILVVSDDPRRDAPFIETAFELREASKESLPVTITGIRTRDRDIGVDAFLTALRLAPTSFANDSVFQLLCMPPVMHGLRLDADEVAELSRACKHAGLLAYVDEKHREAVIGPFNQTAHGTWKAALNSLAMSMAMPDGGHEQVSAADVVAAGGMQATQMDQLAALSRIIGLLEHLRRLAAGGPLAGMLNTAREITGAVFRRPGRWKKSRDAIRDAIGAVEADAASAGFAGDIDYFWLAGELARRLDRANTSTRAMHGGVSLLEPSQARGRTPRVTVFLLSERFPTDDRPLWPEPFLPEYRGGQLRQYADLRDVYSVFMNTRDRAIFVVPSMCDRTYERLSVSSVLHDVRAIAESLQQHGVSFTEADESVAPHSVKSMQSTLPTRHRGAIRGAQALHAARTSGATQRPFAVMDLAHDVPEEVSLDRFIRFFEKPVETFLEHRSIYVSDTEDDYRLREMIWPNFLQRWQVRDAVYRLADEPRVLANLRATATLRADRVGADYLHDQVSAPTAVKAALARATETPIDVLVHYAIGKKKFRLRIHGSALIMDGEAHRHALGSLKARGWLALTTLEAVAIAANRASKARLHYIGQDNKTKADCHTSVASDDPKNPFRGTPSGVSPRQPIPLVNLVRIWHLGHQTPLPLFSEEVQEALPPTAGAPGDLNAAITEFLHTDSGFGAGPGLEANVRAVFRGINPIRDTLYPPHAGVSLSDFERLAQFLSGNIPDAFPML